MIDYPRPAALWNLSEPEHYRDLEEPSSFLILNFSGRKAAGKIKCGKGRAKLVAKFPEETALQGLTEGTHDGNLHR